MNIYQSMKNLGKKALLAGGMAAILSGCPGNSQDKIPQKIFSDVTRDGRKDLVYLKKFYPRIFINGAVPDYELMVAEKQEDETLGDAKCVMQFDSEKPLEVRLEDLNNDGNPDLVYLKKNYPGIFAGRTTQNYELKVANGNGDGTFGESKVIKSYGYLVSNISEELRDILTANGEEVEEINSRLRLAPINCPELTDENAVR